MEEEVRNMNDLEFSNYENPFFLWADSSNTELAAVLLQETEKGIRQPVEQASRILTDTERRYDITEKEMVACFWAIVKFEYELKGRRFTILNRP